MFLAIRLFTRNKSIQINTISFVIRLPGIFWFVGPSHSVVTWCFSYESVIHMNHIHMNLWIQISPSHKDTSEWSKAHPNPVCVYLNLIISVKIPFPNEVTFTGTVGWDFSKHFGRTQFNPQEYFIPDNVYYVASVNGCHKLSRVGNIPF